MSSSTESIHGVIVPLLAPVTEDDRLDAEAYGALIEHCIAGGVDVLFAGGTSGLGPLWPDADWRRMMETALETTADRVPLLGGVIAPSTAVAVERIRFLESIGYRHVVVTPTFYLPPTRPEEFLAHYGACREATSMNLVAYNIPSCTHAPVPVAVLADMATRGWTRHIKESSGDRVYFKQLLEAVGRSGASVLQGNEPDIAWGLRLGATGSVPVCANYAPQLHVAACRAASTGDWERLEALQTRIMEVREVLLLGNKHWIAGALYGVHTLGIGSGRMVQPFLQLDATERARIEAMSAMLAAGAEQ
jgi:4-hydroxy-tetrahydrodipicolinate synthase